MANPEHLARLKSGAAEWNRWRAEMAGGENALLPDLRGADLEDADLRGMNLFRVDLCGATLDGAELEGADFMSAELHGASFDSTDAKGVRFYNADLTRACFNSALLRAANLSSARLNGAFLAHAYAGGAKFVGADLTGADLRNADLTGADFTSAILTNANLTGVDLRRAMLVDTNLDGTHLTGARVHGISAWDLKGVPADQSDLVITSEDEAAVTVDNLKVAQFIYLLMANAEVSGVIDTITSKVVLILGRFTLERKAVLDALRDNLRRRGLSPIVFDFEIPQKRDVTETVTLLARMARYVIADLTDPRSIPQEIQAIAPDVSVPIQPVILAGQEPWSMFRDLRRKYHWVLEPYEYRDQAHLLASLTEVLGPAEAKREELAAR